MKCLINTKTRPQYEAAKSIIETLAGSEYLLLCDGAGKGVRLVKSLKELCDERMTIYDGESLHLVIANTIPIWNRRAAVAIEELGIEDFSIIGSYELTIHEAMDVAFAVGRTYYQPVYGYIPVMETSNCIKKTNGVCDKKSSFETITDRKDISFPIFCDCNNCNNYIYNSVPLSLHNHIKKWPTTGGVFLDFTMESPEQVTEILQFYHGVFSGYSTTEIPFKAFTTGHFTKPVL